VHLVALSPVGEAELVISAIVASLELPAGPGTSLKDALVDQLGDGELLVLLDNFEHASTPRLRSATCSRHAAGCACS
jgi:predicted ATPase